MDPTVVRALQRAVAAFLVTFVVGSGVVFAMHAAGDGGTDAGSPSSSTDPDGSDGGAAAAIPNAYLVWMPEGFPEDIADRLAELEDVRRVAVASVGVAWLTSSVDENGQQVDAPTAGFAVPLEATGIDPRAFAWFLEPGAHRDAIANLGSDQAILSTSAAKLRGLGPGARLTFDDGVELEVAAVVPDAIVGAHELVVTRATAGGLGLLPRYALLRMLAGQSPSAERLTEEMTVAMQDIVRDPAIEVRAPGQAELLRAFDRSLPAVALKRRFGEFTASWDGVGMLDIDDEWQDELLRTKEVPRIGTVRCHKKTLLLLRKAMAQVPDEVSLGETGVCFDPTWTPTMPQGTLPAALWGASIRLNVALNAPGSPPFMEASIREPMKRWGFRWAGYDAYPDGSLFEYVRPPERKDAATPSPTD